MNAGGSRAAISHGECIEDGTRLRRNGWEERAVISRAVRKITSPYIIIYRSARLPLFAKAGPFLCRDPEASVIAPGLRAPDLPEALVPAAALPVETVSQGVLRVVILVVFLGRVKF